MQSFSIQTNEYFGKEKPKLPELTDEDRRSLYAWIDLVQFSRPRRNSIGTNATDSSVRNIARDFCDGVLVAELVASELPNMISLHNYVTASSVNTKTGNFETLNERVLKRLGYQLSASEIEDVVNCRPGAIELLLHNLKKKITNFKENPSMSARRRSSGEVITNYFRGIVNSVTNTDINNSSNRNEKSKPQQLTEEQLNSLNTWIDAVPFSRPRRNSFGKSSSTLPALNRDFSDGVLVAEIVSAELPLMVDLFNYNTALSVDSKIRNFDTLNELVLKRLGYQMTKAEIEDVVNARPGAIESVLYTLKTKIAKFKEINSPSLELKTERRESGSAGTERRDSRNRSLASPSHAEGDSAAFRRDNGGTVAERRDSRNRALNPPSITEGHSGEDDLFKPLELSAEDRRALHAWLDTIKFKRPRRNSMGQFDVRNMTRDFSDGVLVAELLASELPNMVELHEYIPASSLQSKMNNFDMLNERVLQRLNGFQLTRSEIEGVAICRPGAIELVLHALKTQIAKFKENPPSIARRDSRTSTQSTFNLLSPPSTDNFSQASSDGRDSRVQSSLYGPSSPAKPHYAVGLRRDSKTKTSLLGLISSSKDNFGRESEQSRAESSFDHNDHNDHNSSNLTEEQLKSLYAWIDSVPATRPKKPVSDLNFTTAFRVRNLARDYSDGVLVAELVASELPHIIDKVNYIPTQSLQTKIHNFETLNDRVLKRLGYQLTKAEIEDVVNSKQGAIEGVLYTMAIKIVRFKETHQQWKGSAQSAAGLLAAAEEQFRPPELTEEQLSTVHSWIDSVQFNRPRRNSMGASSIGTSSPDLVIRSVARDFSDGVLLAELVASELPQIVELHNYSPASSVQAKIHNFETLNDRVFKRFGYQMTKAEIENVVNSKPGAIEAVLHTLHTKLSKFKDTNPTLAVRRASQSRLGGPSSDSFGQGNNDGRDSRSQSSFSISSPSKSHYAIPIISAQSRLALLPSSPSTDSFAQGNSDGRDSRSQSQLGGPSSPSKPNYAAPLRRGSTTKTSLLGLVSSSKDNFGRESEQSRAESSMDHNDYSEQWSAPQMAEEQLKSLYAWIDSVPATRPKKPVSDLNFTTAFRVRNLARDFSDGVLVAELVASELPHIIDKVSYIPTQSLQTKIHNFETLNDRVLKRLGYQLTRYEIEDVVDCKPGAIEWVLYTLAIMIWNFKETHQQWKGSAQSAAGLLAAADAQYRSPELTEEQVNAVHSWVDSVQFIRPRRNSIGTSSMGTSSPDLFARNMARDFSDGVLLAELVASELPQIVELHNYAPASSVQAKIHNFETLNKRVLKLLGYQLTKAEIEDLIHSKPGTIELVLHTMRLRMARYKENPPQHVHRDTHYAAPLRRDSRTPSQLGHLSSSTDNFGHGNSDGKDSLPGHRDSKTPSQFGLISSSNDHITQGHSQSDPKDSWYLSQPQSTEAVSGSNDQIKLPDLAEEDLKLLYTWIDSVSSTRIKSHPSGLKSTSGLNSTSFHPRNIAQDFSDGILVAELVASQLPQIIDMVNYAPATTDHGKIHNFDTLNERVLKRLGYQMTKAEIEDVVHCRSGAIEWVLLTLAVKIWKFKEAHPQWKGSGHSTDLDAASSDQLRLPELTDEDHRSIYAWIDSVPFKRARRNSMGANSIGTSSPDHSARIARDFSDGVFLAELVASELPQIVELHNYVSASATQLKIYNFETLNERVLKRLGYQLTKAEIEDVVNCKPGAIEAVLLVLRTKIANFKENPQLARRDSKEVSPQLARRDSKEVNPQLARRDSKDINPQPVRRDSKEGNPVSVNPSPTRRGSKLTESPSKVYPTSIPEGNVIRLDSKKNLNARVPPGSKSKVADIETLHAEVAQAQKSGCILS